MPESVEEVSAGNSWVSVFKKFKPVKLHYLAISTGGAAGIFRRVAREFEHAGFTPTHYLELVVALNSEPLVNHPNNSFKVSAHPGGGQRASDVVITASDFEHFPGLRAAGFTPIEAVTALLEWQLN